MSINVSTRQEVKELPDIYFKNMGRIGLAKILLLIFVAICIGKSSAKSNELKIEGIWHINFLPPYMVPNWRRNTESNFYLNLSRQGAHRIIGKAIWEFGNTPNDDANYVWAAIDGKVDQNNAQLLLIQPRQNETILTLKGKIEGEEIKGSVVRENYSDCRPLFLKGPGGPVKVIGLPHTGDFVMRRIKPEYEEYVYKLFEIQNSKYTDDGQRKNATNVY